MLRAVVDTNVIVSGTIQKSGYPFDVLNAWRDGRFLLAVSEPIVAEVERVLHYPKIRKKYGLTERQVSDVVGCLRRYGLMTPGTLDVKVVKENPDDDKFIQSALEGQADYIVSGDQHLIGMRTHQGVGIVSAREFARLLTKDSV